VSVSLQFVRFLVVGAVNTAFGYGVFAITVLAGALPLVALVVTYIIGVIFNYFTTGKFVFKRGGGAAAFVRFVSAYVLIYAFNVGMYKLINILVANPLLVQAMCVPIVATFSFVLFKFHVFKDPVDVGLAAHQASSK